MLPTLWFRNTWSWGDGHPKPSLTEAAPGSIRATHPELGDYWLSCDGSPELLFTENESNAQRLWGQPNASPYVKDAFHAYVVAGDREAVNPAKTGTKAAAHYILDVPAGGSQTVRVRLSAARPADGFNGFDRVFTSRIADADEFYDRIAPPSLSEDQRRVHRQALAGMLWSKQFYYFDLERWLTEHKSHPLLESARPGVRNTEWFHMLNADIISMPDKWEYPWYAAWDLAFHTTALALVDFDFAKDQLLLMLRNLYVHPNGQIPAYEWNFSDVNPPVHAWATLYLYKMERTLGRSDLRFLERAFQGLMLNFNWWVNRKDPAGRNVFAGGFLGLDNIGVFDRSAQLPTGGSLEQADGTAWMAFYCQCMLEMSLILTEYDAMYEEVAFKFVQHFMWISYAMDRIGEHHDEMWDEEDGFFYDLLRLPNGEAMRLKVRSLVGLLPLCASTVFEGDAVARYPKLMEMIELFKKRHPELVSHVAPTDKGFVGVNDRRLLSILNKQKLERVLGYLLDENEFLGPHGIRSLSRYHLDHPFTFRVGHDEYKVQYLPGGIEHRHVRRQLQLAGPGVDAGQRADRPRAAEPVPVLRRRLQGPVPHGFGPVHDAVRSRAGDCSGGWRHVPARRQRTTARLRRLGQVPERPALARPDSVLRVLPRRQRRGPRGQPPDRLDGSRRAPPRSLRARRCQGHAGNRAWQADREVGEGTGRRKTGRRLTHAEANH